MSKRAFDLMPPYPQPAKYHHHESKAKKKKTKSQKTFLFFIFGLFFICALYVLSKLDGFNQMTPAPSTGNSNTSNIPVNTKFELFKEQGSSILTKEQAPIKIRVLNGANMTTNLNTAKDLLLAAGFQIEKSETANNISEQTIIYYKNGQVSLAQKAADALKPNFTAQLQESASLDKNYDILIIIGNK